MREPPAARGLTLGLQSHCTTGLSISRLRSCIEVPEGWRNNPDAVLIHTPPLGHDFEIHRPPD